MLKKFEKHAKIWALLQLFCTTGLAVCSIWYGAWFPDAQTKLYERLHATNPKAEKPNFWQTSLSDIDYKSPAPYTLIFLFFSAMGGASILASAYSLEDLKKRETEFKKEQEDHAETQQYYYESLKDHLSHIFCQQIENFDDTCRASVYRHDSKAKLFRMIFRYSKITRFEEKGRVSLPEREGIIGATYLNGDSVYICDLPSKTSARGYSKETNKKLEEFGVQIPEMTLNKLNMPSRCYYGFSIRDLSSREKFAILIIESTNANQFDSNKISEQLSMQSTKIAQYVRHIAQIDSKLNPYGGA